MPVMRAPAVFTDGALVHQVSLSTLPTTINTLCQQTIGKPAAEGASSLPLVKVARTTNQSIVSSTNTLISWSSAAVDSDGIWLNSATASQLLIATSGWYRITAQISWPSAAASVRSIGILVNGTLNSANVVATTSMITAATLAIRQQVSAYERLAAGAVVYVNLYQSSGGTISALSSPYGTWCTAQWDAPY